MVPTPPSERIKQGKRLLTVSRTALYRIATLAMAYRLYGNKAHLDRAIDEMRAVCAFSDWNPSHFLDVGEMTLAVAIARDWLDGFLSDEDRGTLSSAILLKGLTTGDGKTLSDGWWVKGGNNWNQVCNGGLAAGAAGGGSRSGVPATLARTAAASVSEPGAAASSAACAFSHSAMAASISSCRS